MHILACRLTSDVTVGLGTALLRSSPCSHLACVGADTLSLTGWVGGLVHVLACRLTSDVTGLEIVPTIEDVFHAETNSVEEYLQQVEEATLLAAIQVSPTLRGFSEGLEGKACQ